MGGGFVKLEVINGNLTKYTVSRKKRATFFEYSCCVLAIVMIFVSVEIHK